MKNQILFMSLLALFTAPAAFAAHQVQYQVAVEVGTCTLDQAGNDASCTWDRKGGISETVVVDLVSSPCKPTCPVNDNSQRTKKYTLKRPDNGLPFSVDVTTTIGHFVDASLPDSYNVELAISPSDGTRGDERSSFTSVKDIKAFGAALLTSKSIPYIANDGSPSRFYVSLQLSKVVIPN